MSDGMNRRKFLKVLGVTGGGATAAAACGGGDRATSLIPYLVPVEDQIPGTWTAYASTCRECPAGCGLHVRVREGRAVKVQGNPEHPVNRGRLCARAQASLQGTYNPDRVRQPMAKNDAGTFEPIGWDDAIARIAQRLGGVPAERVWFLTGVERGSFGRFVDEWLRALGGGRRVVYEPFGYEALRHAGAAVFGARELPAYRLGEAEYILSFGADFLETWLSPVEHARGFAEAHAYDDGTMGRYVHVEPRMSMTAMSADEWIAPAPGTEAAVALAMAHVIVTDGLGRLPADAARLRAALAPFTPDAAAARCEVPAETIRRLAHEFAAHPSVALPGGTGSQHAQAHLTAAAVHVLNYVAGNIGRTVRFGADPDPSGASSYENLRALMDAAQAGNVGVLFVHDSNPAYAAPGAGAGVVEALGRVPFIVSFSRFLDETTAEADLILPDHDPMEQWNDRVPGAGVWSLQQPVMRPVMDTRQTGDVLLQVARQAGGPLGGFPPAAGTATWKDYLQGRWRDVQRQVGDRRPFETFWHDAVRRGGVWTDPPSRPVRLAASAADALVMPEAAAPNGRFALIAYPSLALYDGRAANRPWMQELPDPVTKVTWGSWVEMHPDSMAQLGVAEGDHVEIATPDGSVEVPAYPHPGLRPDTVAMPTGQGHRAYGRWAEGRGANVYGLLPAAPTVFGGIQHQVAVTIRPTGAHERLPKTEGRRTQLDRGIAQSVTLAGIAHGALDHLYHAAHAAEVPEHEGEVFGQVQEMYGEERDYGPYRFDRTNWGMSIDLSRCTGCSACVAACSAENNVPFVGAQAVRRGREMHWIRIERYFAGGEDGEPVRADLVPMLCQQCGKAPCEPVCPVFAAYHTPDGLNGQVYNRCVGTRYCGNNCPYKVRYFNWWDHGTPGDPLYAWPEPMNWLLNPDVTVREKGVMEKCTFCVQRIRRAQHEARVRGTPLRDGEVVTACQETCPTNAIVFGNLNDPDARVAQLRRNPRGYRVLEGLNTEPSITYLVKVRNLGAEGEA